jgi:hypothetical protein
VQLEELALSMNIHAVVSWQYQKSGQSLTRILARLHAVFRWTSQSSCYKHSSIQE